MAGSARCFIFGENSITFNGGLQFTARRDTISPVFMSQNLFRQFLYISTNSFFNWVSVTGSAQHETGPFIDQNLHSRDLFANVEFTVGRPWGNTSLITGYSVRDLLFRPVDRRIFQYHLATWDCSTNSASDSQRQCLPRICAPGEYWVQTMQSPRRSCPEDALISMQLLDGAFKDRSFFRADRDFIPMTMFRVSFSSRTCARYAAV